MDIQGIAIERLHPFSFSDAERDKRWGSSEGGDGRARSRCAGRVGFLGRVRPQQREHALAREREFGGIPLVFPLDGGTGPFSFENGLNPGWVTDWRGAVPEFAKAVAAHVEEAGSRPVPASASSRCQGCTAS